MHYGVVEDPLPNREFTYGVPTEKSEGAGNVMRVGEKGRIGNFINDLK
jgi:hypothetical protein